MNNDVTLNRDNAQELETLLRVICNAIETKSLDYLVEEGLAEAVQVFADQLDHRLLVEQN